MVSKAETLRMDGMRSSGADAESRDARRFLVSYTALLAILTLGMGVLNYVVDPYEIFPPSRLQLDLVRTEYATKLEHNKRVQVYRRQPDCLLMGSSRAQYLNPDHAALGAFRCFNIAGGYIRSIANAYEALLSATRMSDLELVILGLDLRMFTDTPFSRQVAARDRPEAVSKMLQYLFSSTTLYDSLLTLIDQLDRDLVPLELPNGQRNAEFEYRKIEGLGGHKAAFRSTVSRVNTRVLDQVTLDAEVLGYLEQLFELAHSKRIDLRIYFSPSHAWWWNVIARQGHWDQFEAMKRHVVSINESVAARMGRRPFPVYDFSGYSAYTTVEPTRARMDYHFEASHFTPKLADKVLNTLMGTGEEAGFGVRLDPDNLESHLADLRQQRDRYLAGSAAP